ncbi:MAG: metallophosphoesterase [Bacilli bacterium]|nr:metallophosphoesterase [Bacilli bacterium]MBP3635467.1 metallophosphoesterase [Bacilli bacterium]
MNRTNIDDYSIESLIDEEKPKKRPLRKLFFYIILIIIITIIYSRYVGTSGLFIKEYSIESNKITEKFNGFKIAHFSDFHFGRTTSTSELKQLVDEINLTKPDIVIFTGDFIDKDVKITDKELSYIIDELSKINSTYGNYYVNGNHDLKYDKFYQMFESANFINLNNTYDVVYNTNNEAILLSGLSTNKDTVFLEEALKDDNYIYKINIMHYPDYISDIKKYNFDLVLAGHSHNGQVRIPFYGAIYTPNYAKKYYKEYYKVDNTDFYISSGIGTSMYNFRLFNRPSFNLYRLRKVNQ